MKEFIREYWLWTVIPFALVILAVLAIYLLTGDDATSPFQYNVL